jgi:hypothetical protein
VLYVQTKRTLTRPYLEHAQSMGILSVIAVRVAGGIVLFEANEEIE